MNLPFMNRRRLLLGLAAASTAATVTAIPAIASVNAGPTENADLIRLGDLLDPIAAEHDEAEAAYWDIVHVWGARVPLAPDAITYVTGRYAGGDDWERTIHGHAMMPDGSVYDGAKNSPMPRSVELADYFSDRIKNLRSAIARKRPKHPLSALDVAQLEMEIGLLADKHAMAEAYEAERARIIAASGIAAATTRLDVATEALAGLVEQIMSTDETTMAGVIIKAQAIAAWNEVATWRRLLPSIKGEWDARLAASILRIAEGGNAA